MNIIPLPWKIAGGVVLVAGAVLLYRGQVSAAYDRGHAAAVSQRAARDAAAVSSRATENVKVGKEQDKINVDITKEKNEAIAPVIRTIYVDRVRVGTGICGPTAAPQTEDASSSDSGNPATRLVSPEAERHIRELEVEVETHFATGRACQEFGKRNGFYP